MFSFYGYVTRSISYVSEFDDPATTASMVMTLSLKSKFSVSQLALSWTFMISVIKSSTPSNSHLTLNSMAFPPASIFVESI